MYLYRTNGTGKSARTRSFDLADADAGYHFNGYPHDLGFVRDTTARFAALGLAGTGAFVRGLNLLTGGAKGPNRTYDAWYEDPPGAGLFWLVRPLRDCDGDGWDDFISGNSGYGGFNRGIAVVFAGGPYIPIDDSSASVRQYSLDGTLSALSLWP